MPTHAEITARLLKDAADFFVNMAETNADIRKEMTENATMFRQTSQAMMTQPAGEQNGIKFATLAGTMLKNAAKFFRAVAEKNEPIKEQMLRSADIYEQMGQIVAEDPLGIMD